MRIGNSRKHDGVHPSNGLHYSFINKYCEIKIHVPRRISNNDIRNYIMHFFDSDYINAEMKYA